MWPQSLRGDLLQQTSALWQLCVHLVRDLVSNKKYNTFPCDVWERKENYCLHIHAHFPGADINLWDSGVWLVATLSFYALPVVYRSPNFNVPLKPITASVGILASLHLICALQMTAFLRFGLWQCAGVLFYFLYCLQQDRTSSDEASETIALVEDDAVESAAIES